METCFVLYACCIPVKGARRSTVCDLQRGKYYFITDALYEILTTSPGAPIDTIKEKYNHEYDEVIDEYFSYLLDNDIGFFTDTPGNFPVLDMEWDTPSAISNAIVDVASDSNHPYEKIFHALDRLNCATIQLRFYDEVLLEEVDAILSHCSESRLKSIELLLKYNPSWATGSLRELCKKHSRVVQAVVHSAPASEARIDRNLKVTFVWIEDAVNNETHCGQVHPAHFRVNLPLFSESQLNNSCLNRKISVDSRGFIRNCPSTPTAYGHIADTDLADVAANPAFKKLWSISKNEILICKDCEFRHVCTDCRAYTQEGNLYGKPAKCSYDPYTATWADAADDPKANEYRKVKAGQTESAK